MPYSASTWFNGDLITDVKANNWETQYTQAYTDGLAEIIKYSEINRQIVIDGAVGTDGRANFITGSALSAFATASTADPLLFSFAGGNSSVGGINYLEQLTTTSTWTGLSANNTNYLFFDRSTSGVITQGFTLIPPLYGRFLNVATTNYSLLHWDGAAGSTVTTDTFTGHTWSNFGAAMLSTVQIQFGSASLLLNESSDSYVQTTTITEMGSSDWTFEGWFYPTSTTGFRKTLISSINGFGIQLYFLEGSFTRLTIADSTIAVFIVDSSGSITITANNWHHWALSYNSSTYRVWIDGAIDNSIASTLIMNSVLGGIRLGADYNFSFPLKGNLDEYRITRGVSRYNVAFTPSTAAFGTDTYFYNLRENILYDPFIEIRKLFIGEAVTGSTSVTSVTTYALQGINSITSTGLAVSATQSFNHNIGIRPNAEAYLINLSSELGYLPGDELPILPNYYDGVSNRNFTITTDETTVKILTGATALAINNKGTTTLTAITMASWGIKFYLSRPFK